LSAPPTHLAEDVCPEVPADELDDVERVGQALAAGREALGAAAARARARGLGALHHVLARGQGQAARARARAARQVLVEGVDEQVQRRRRHGRPRNRRHGGHRRAGGARRAQVGPGTLRRQGGVSATGAAA